MTAPQRLAARGLTLVEALVAVAVLGVILAVATPSLRDLMERRRVIAAATELASLINYAKAEAAKQRGGNDSGFTLHLEPPADASTSCARLSNYSAGDSCRCNVAKANLCRNSTSTIVREFVLDRSTGVSFVATADNWGVSNRKVVFKRNEFNYFTLIDNLRLTVTGQRSGAQLRVEFNTAGRVHICSPGGTIGGYPSCG